MAEPLVMSAGYQLRDEVAALADAVVACEFSRNPRLRLRYWPGGRGKSRQDAAYHLAFLADAVDVDSQAVFNDYIAWAKVLLLHFGVLAEDLDQHLGCMADVEVNCKAHCTKPTGGIFCNGQFVNATDVEACIAHLATKFKINVDVTARASASGGCSSGNCGGNASAGASLSVPKAPSTSGGNGCASSPGSSNGVTGVLALVGAVAVASGIRARRRRDRR